MSMRNKIIGFFDKPIVRNLIIIGLCIALGLFQVFFPYLYFSSPPRNVNSTFTVGITYNYQDDPIEKIFGEVSAIHSVGFKTIRITLQFDNTTTNGPTNMKTDAFYAAAAHFNLTVALIIMNHDDNEMIQNYMNRWGPHITYIQVLNEPESASSWDVGALFTDDEIISKFQQVYAIVESYRSHAKLYTNFEPAAVARINIPIQVSKNLDFVGYDVYMESNLVMAPDFVQFLHTATNKDVVITEFGITTSNETAQSNFIIQGLNLFKNMGLKSCWLVYWNDPTLYYGIRGRLAEKTVGEWIAQNAQNAKTP
jgi:hypothetical protein